MFGKQVRLLVYFRSPNIFGQLKIYLGRMWTIYMDKFSYHFLSSSHGDASSYLGMFDIYFWETMRRKTSQAKAKRNRHRDFEKFD